MKYIVLLSFVAMALMIALDTPAFVQCCSMIFAGVVWFGYSRSNEYKKS